jgi:hypothetical protein
MGVRWSDDARPLIDSGLDLLREMLLDTGSPGAESGSDANEVPF